MGPGFESLKVHHPLKRGAPNNKKAEETQVMNSYLEVSVISGEGPPVPIPNTVVKLICADNTWLETAR